MPRRAPSLLIRLSARSEAFLSVALAAPNLPRFSWTVPAPPASIRPSNLTGFLEQATNLTGALLPDSRAAITRLNQLLRPASKVIKPSATTARLKLHGRLGQAVDRAAIHLIGTDTMERPRAKLKHGTGTAKRILDALEIHATSETPAVLDASRIETLGWLVVMGALEPVFRRFRTLTDISMDGLKTGRLTRARVSAWLATQIPTAEFGEELRQLLLSLATCLPTGPYRANPVFGRHNAVLSSDGDLIAGDALVEVKCVVGGVERPAVAQLLGYYAIDRLRRAQGRKNLGFSELALCLPRQRQTIRGPVGEWLRLFGGPPPDRFVQLFDAYTSAAWKALSAGPT